MGNSARRNFRKFEISSTKSQIAKKYWTKKIWLERSYERRKDCPSVRRNYIFRR